VRGGEAFARGGATGGETNPALRIGKLPVAGRDLWALGVSLRFRASGPRATAGVRRLGAHGRKVRAPQGRVVGNAHRSRASARG
jgi:hypothetical protein